MMKYVIISLFLFISINLFGQKKVELRFLTDGVCGMCENRIEKALIDLAGVWHADWNVKNLETLVVYRPKKISEKKIHTVIANLGHDQILGDGINKIIAPIEIYNELPACCKYRDPHVKKDHVTGG